MPKKEGQKGKTMIHKTLRNRIEQHDPPQKPGVNSCTPGG